MGATEQLSTTQNFARITETELSIRHICEGLRELNRLGPANDRPEIALQLLAQGLERLAKLVLILGTLERERRLMSLGELKKYGHRVDDLVEAVVKLCESSGYTEGRTGLEADLKFLRDDELLVKLVSLISDFGDGGRYHGLNALLGSAGGDGPVDHFHEIELDFLSSHPEWTARLGEPEFDEFYEIMYGEMTAKIQRAVRALCRMFTMGLLGDDGLALSGIVAPFLYLMDDQLKTVPARCSR